jgi:hypothetical protein
MKWRLWRWRWQSEDRPGYLSGPRRKEPRSAAERLLALETKFLLFWVGQERDSVLLRSPAPRSDCSGRRERNLPVATLWPSPTSSTLGGRRFRAEKGGGGQAGAGHGPLDRWKGQTKLVHGAVRWSRWKGRPARSPGCGRWLGFWPAPGFENSRDGLGTTRR